MDIEVSKLLQLEYPSTTVRCCGDYIVSTARGRSDKICRVELYSTNEAPVRRIAEWQIPGATDIGNIVAVDSVNEVVYAAHDNSSYLSVLPTNNTKNGLSGARQAVAVPFEGKIVSIVRFNAFVALVSENSEIAVLPCSSTSGNTSSYKISLSFSNRVAAVSKCGDHGLVLASLVESGHLEVRVVQLEIVSDSPRCRAVEKPVIRVSSVAKSGQNCLVLGCIIQSQSMFVLYSDGTLHTFHAENYNPVLHKDTLSAWWSPSLSSPDGVKDPVILKPSSAFQLLANPPRNVGKNSSVLPNGALCSLGNQYAVVAYGKYCSVWDSSFRTGHGFTLLKDPICRVVPSDEFRTVLLETKEAVYSMEMNSITAKGMSLAEAMKSKGCCNAILSGPGKGMLMKAQPVTVNLLKTVADAGGDFARGYQKHLQSDDVDEANLVKRIFFRGRTPTSFDLRGATMRYVRESGKLRRGNYGEQSELGLAKLPSQHIAAATCARCLYEIYEGKLEFVVPFIDMVGTGVVSNEAVLATLRTWDMQLNYKTTNLTSIAGVLARSQKTLYALEAAVAAISDLPEADIVRAAQMATRMRSLFLKERSEMAKEGIAKKNGLSKEKLTARRKANNDLSRKANRLLLRCVVARVDRLKLIEALRKMPQHDVKSMLTYFMVILDKYSTRQALGEPFLDKKSKMKSKDTAECMTDEQCICYTGVECWLDTHQVSTVKGIGTESQELRGCIEWANLVLDAHLASLVLDNEGRKTVESLLLSVSSQRKISEAMSPMMGALEHIVADIPLPKHKSLYNVRREAISLCYSLQSTATTD